MPTSLHSDDAPEHDDGAIDRLERKIDALAGEVGVEFAGQCARCEEGLVIVRDGALVCSRCSFSRAL